MWRLCSCDLLLHPSSSFSGRPFASVRCVMPSHRTRTHWPHVTSQVSLPPAQVSQHLPSDSFSPTTLQPALFTPPSPARPDREFLDEPPHFCFHLESVVFSPMTHSGRCPNHFLFCFQLFSLFGHSKTTLISTRHI